MQPYPVDIDPEQIVRCVIAEHEVAPSTLKTLGAFYKQFICSGRGTASVTAEVQDPTAEVRMACLLEAIERNRHSPGKSRD